MDVSSLKASTESNSWTETQQINAHSLIPTRLLLDALPEPPALSVFGQTGSLILEGRHFGPG